MDKVDEILSQWRTVRPDLDVAPMGTVGRISRVAGQFAGEMSTTFESHGINAAAFDMLATLKRAGPPYRRSIGEMMDWMMISSGSTTNRIQRLEQAGLIKRIVNTEDGRKAYVQLTKAGIDKIDAAVADHVATQAKLISCLSEDEKQFLEQVLRKIAASVTPDRSNT